MLCVRYYISWIIRWKTDIKFFYHEHKIHMVEIKVMRILWPAVAYVRHHLLVCIYCGHTNANTWLRLTLLPYYKSDNVTVTAPNLFVSTWFFMFQEGNCILKCLLSLIFMNNESTLKFFFINIIISTPNYCLSCGL